MINTTALIIGGGLSGLVTAWELTRCGIDFRLIEARERFGGRILSEPILDSKADQSSAVDLGPAWFWPGQQNMLQLISEMGLKDSVFLQPTSGMSVMEYQNGKIERGMGSASMPDSYRLEGGINSLILQLVNHVTAKNLVSNVVATQLTMKNTGVSTTVLVNGVTQTIESQHVVLALPPRLVGEYLTFTPPLPGTTNNQLKSIATWMAGQAKFAAVYAQAFWRDQGLSGEGFSQRGPLVEIHDASSVKGGPYALFGFVGVPAQHRQEHGVAIKQAAIEQLARMFGEAAHEPAAVHLQDWAFEPYTSTEADRSSQGSHSRSSVLPETEWDDRIVWSGSESACLNEHANGYLEGAVESGRRAAVIISRHLDSLQN